MSQKKVDAYKEAKKTRKEDLAKEKKAKQLRRIIGWVVLALAVVALGIGLYITVKNIREKTAEDNSAYQVSDYELEDYANIAGTTEAPTEAPTESPAVTESAEATEAASAENTSEAASAGSN
ncbi:MAG: hypothetical protein J6Z38_05125 [Lachnospiraceae bacterium]|nr:hypothetical protein [Lachnospiraceae bacterium]